MNGPEIELEATKFKELSTKLSDQLEVFEMFLNSLDGKVEVSVHNGPFALAWERIGGTWKLMIGFGDTDVPVKSADVGMKIRSAEMAEELLREIELKYSHQNSEMVLRIKELDTLLKMESKS